MIETQPSDSELLLRAGEGDREAGADLLEHYRDRLRRMIGLRLDKRVAARVDASDIVQEALNKARARLPQYLASPPMALYPWLRRIAWDRLLKVHRDHIDVAKRSVEREHAWRPRLNDESVADLAHRLVTSTISPSRRVVQAEMQAQMKEALLALKPPDREILVLRYLEQLSVEEIADVLGISQTAVTSRQLRALQRLRRRLGDEFGAW
ncbi:MAG: sigma-70 family RNA polymerase sigma factor [Pirellulales bacterium]